MKNTYFQTLLLSFLILLFSFSVFADNQVAPKDYFGFTPGDDRMLFDYQALIDYLKILDEASPRLLMVQIGSSPESRPMYIAFISDPENIQNLESLKTINRELALNPKISEEKMTAYLQNGKVFLLATMSMHSGEVAPSQSVPLIAYQMITTEDPVLLQQMVDVVLMIVPCHNPDGMDKVVHYYNETKGTKYEGSSLPEVYHKYVGHDNNRDFVILSQEDTKAIARIYNQDWFPQVMVEKHQMMKEGPRYFVPPNHDPIAENIDAEIWNWTWIFGSNMAKDMTRAGLKGVSQHNLFDEYWPGATETCLWKNVIGLLTEAASVQYAKPVYIEKNELRVYGKGLSTYDKSINMVDPWEGGWWRLSDIVQYEIESTFSLVKTSAMHREAILKFRNDMCRKEIQKGKTEAPYYYILPEKQHDAGEWVALVQLLQEHGIQVYRIRKDIQLNDIQYYAGDVVVPLAQPFRAFIKEAMEKQEFPVRKYTPEGPIIKPYDITTWSLPLHRGVKSVEINQRYPALEKLLMPVDTEFAIETSLPSDYTAIVLPVNQNQSFRIAFHALAKNISVRRILEEAQADSKTIPAGSFIIEGKASAEELEALFEVPPLYISEKLKVSTESLIMPAVGIVQTWLHDMDAGWTRFVFDEYSIPFQVIRPGDVASGKLENFDCLIFPDTHKDILMSGKYKSQDRYRLSDYAPEYTKGMGEKGKEKLIQYLDSGGHLIAWGRSTDLFTGIQSLKISKDEKVEFELPYNNVAETMSKKGLYCPGSLVNVQFINDHPLTWGMPETQGVFYRGRPVFITSVPNFDMDRRVIGMFPEKDIVASGYCENEALLKNKAAMVWIKKGEGQLTLMAFGPQFRASTQGTFKLLMNAILLSKFD